MAPDAAVINSRFNKKAQKPVSSQKIFQHEFRCHNSDNNSDW